MAGQECQLHLEPQHVVARRHARTLQLARLVQARQRVTALKDQLVAAELAFSLRVETGIHENGFLSRQLDQERLDRGRDRLGDLALRLDPVYGPISRRFYENPDEFADAFALLDLFHELLARRDAPPPTVRFDGKDDCLTLAAARDPLDQLTLVMVAGPRTAPGPPRPSPGRWPYRWSWYRAW